MSQQNLAKICTYSIAFGGLGNSGSLVVKAPEDELAALAETILCQHVAQSAHAEHVPNCGGCRVILAEAAEHPMSLRSQPASRLSGGAGPCSTAVMCPMHARFQERAEGDKWQSVRNERKPSPGSLHHICDNQYTG